MRGRFVPKGLTGVEEMESRGVRGVIDLRSDTVTRPGPEMRRAMAVAVVGDDDQGEDPSVNRLEARAAELLEREAALFVPTGTMANQIAVHLQAGRGEDLVCEQRAHVNAVERASVAMLSGVSIRPVATRNGILTWGDLLPALQPEPAVQRPRTAVVVYENTHNLAGGVVTPPALTAYLCGELRARGIRTHLDGARIFNAAAVLGISAAELARPFDTVMFCLSKGLGAPIGSLLLGSAELIRTARRVRKLLGGGWRQAGVVAAAGLVALDKGPARLAEDHALARLLAEGAAQLPGLRLDPAAVQTNIVIFEVTDPEQDAFQVRERLRERNVLVHALDRRQIRLVTHLDIDRAQAEEALFALRAVLARG